MSKPKSFAKTLRKAAKEAWRNGDLSRWDLAKVRLATRINPAGIQEAQAAVEDEAMAAGLCMSNETFGEGFDWDALLAFITKLLPLILQLIALF